MHGEKKIPKKRRCALVRGRLVLLLLARVQTPQCLQMRHEEGQEANVMLLDCVSPAGHVIRRLTTDWWRRSGSMMLSEAVGDERAFVAWAGLLLMSITGITHDRAEVVSNWFGPDRDCSGL